MNIIFKFGIKTYDINNKSNENIDLHKFECYKNGEKLKILKTITNV